MKSFPLLVDFDRSQKMFTLTISIKKQGMVLEPIATILLLNEDVQPLDNAGVYFSSKGAEWADTLLGIKAKNVF